ncbi:hypothetical protein B0H13DRAFT_358063 [Mycena leptocephala]|nr:hypothetical protein B0H13DRAFT_358063 [Mycena leptocephala]
MSQPAPSSPKKTLQKKRHTKPCRYFQTGSCPHATQEDCDFAHLFSDSASMPTTQQCGCYPQGTSTDGIWCQYGYGEEITEDVPLLQGQRYSSGI